VDKLAAMRWVVDRLGLRPHQAIFAGDGTNDPLLPAALAGFKVIAVGNTHPALKRQLRRQRVDNLFIAQQTHAAGVLEGLAHFAGKGW
jgi:hydroxymethylpyrimidine pyrophosphatase-like HAD family hydrolase